MRKVEYISNPNCSSLVNFIHSIEEQKYSKRAIREAFNKYVDKDDYDSKDKEFIIKWMGKL